jgi:hypothetical protein
MGTELCWVVEWAGGGMVERNIMVMGTGEGYRQSTSTNTFKNSKQSLEEPGWLGTASGVRAASMGGGELGGTRLHELARVSMVTPMTRWPPVSGHPAMKVTIKVQFGRAGEGGTR